MNKDFLLKDKINIYNNLAKSGESSGRLSVVYNVYPAPAIFWEFEPESKSIGLPKHDTKGELIKPFECNNFSMSNPSSDRVYLMGGEILTGSTARSISGNLDIKGKYFTFFLPNAKFQELGASGKNYLIKEINYKNTESSSVLGENSREGFAEMTFENGITLTLHTPTESLDWLKADRSIGTYITTEGKLSVENEWSILEAVDFLYDISLLLSFANGGFVAPIVVAMTPLDFEKEYPIVYTAYLVDSVEHVAGTWLDRKSNIGDLIKCTPSFQKMLQSEQWKENYAYILMWYFQSIQHQGIQLGGKPWPVVANALGTALEKLASIILVEEKGVVAGADLYGDNKKPKMNLETKIRKLLETIGLPVVGPKYSVKGLKYGSHDYLWWFVKMRNDATHPKSIHDWKQHEINMFLGSAIQWVEETLLWRLGYDGGYINKIGNGGYFSSPRYNNDLRDSSW
ncbi:MAG TPA: hypothetical protein PLR65_05570 [Anaerolineales bacterium]|nr:hypothetical protein [Anaerolineales bacterium]